MPDEHCPFCGGILRDPPTCCVEATDHWERLNQLNLCMDCGHGLMEHQAEEGTCLKCKCMGWTPHVPREFLRLAAAALNNLISWKRLVEDLQRKGARDFQIKKLKNLTMKEAFKRLSE